MKYIVYSIVGLLGVYVAVFGYLFFKRLHIGKALAKEAQPYQQELRNPKYSFLIIGDSTVVGVGASSPEDSVSGRIGKDFERAEILTLGRNGRKTKELIPLLEELQGESFDLVEVHTGGNDTIRFTKLEDMRADLQRIILLAKGLSDNIIIVSHGNIGVVPMFPPGVRWLYQMRTQSMRKIFTEVTDVNEVTYIDLYRTRKEDVFYLDPDTYYAPDYLHPSSEGYALWYDLIKPEIEAFGLEPSK